MTRPRSFHLWNLPTKSVYVQLDEAYAHSFFAILRSQMPLSQIAALNGFSEEATVRQLVGNDRERFVRASSLLRLSRALGAEGFNPSHLESHIVAVKGYRRAGTVYDTHFPIEESTSVIRVLFHFLGDGFLHSVIGSAKASSYSNQCAHLRKRFIKCLRSFFGDISSCVGEDLSSPTRLKVRLPKWIGYVLVHWYPDAKFGQMACRMPSAVFSLPRALQIEAVRTLADDDGSPQELCIRFVSGSQGLLEDLRKLIGQLIDTDEALSDQERRVLLRAVSNVRRQKTWYRLDLGVPCFKWFYRMIGFTHPEKQKELGLRIRAIDRSSQLTPLDHDLIIYYELSKRPKTAREIAETHIIREDYVHRALKIQRRRKRVTTVGRKLKRKRYAALWSLTPEGRSWFEVVLHNGSRSFDDRDRRRYGNLPVTSARERLHSILWTVS